MATHTEKAVANEHDTSLSKEARLLLDDTERFVTIDGLSSEQKIAIAELLHSNMVSLEMSSDEDFYYSYDTEYEDAIAEIVQSNKWQKRSFTKEHLAANKLYAALLLNTLRQKDKKEKITPQSDISRKVYMNYFSRSPSVTSYVSGGLSGQIELLALADKSPTTRQLMYNMAGEIIYNYSFTDKGAGEFILNGWMNARTIEAQIGYIHVIENLGKDASTQGYAYDFVSGACDALVRISGDKDLPPFITIIAWSAACMIKDYYERVNGDDYIDDAEVLNTIFAAEIERRSYEQRRELEYQAALHNEYSQFSKDTKLYRLSSGACASQDDGTLETIVDLAGDSIDLTDPAKNNKWGFTEGDAELIQAAHRSEIRHIIESRLSLNLSGLTLRAQVRLLRFMAEAGDERYEKLGDTLSKLDDEERYLVAETFLSAEFGDDYGDSILSIAECASPEQSKEIFEIINEFRMHAHQFSKWFKSHDPEFATATELAMNERLTDALSALELLAKDGKLEVDVAPHRHNEDYENDGRFMLHLRSLDEGIEIIRNLKDSLKLLPEIVMAEDTHVSKVVEDNENFMLYRFSNTKHGDSLLYVRPEGAKGYDRQFEYGTAKGVEASISFIVNSLDPHHLRSDKDPGGVSIRFDREGRIAGESPFSEERDPTRRDGSISVDISSGLGNVRDMPVKIGRFIAAGNIIRAGRIGGYESLHHNTNHFDQQQYGSSEGFAALAWYTARMAEVKLSLQKAHRRRQLGAQAGKLSA